MGFTDRMMATDRAVANYRRFSHSPNNETAAHLLIDLLHWHSRFCDFGFTVEKAHDMLLEALNSFVEEFEVEKEAANPLRGERPLRDVPRTQTCEYLNELSNLRYRVHDELVFDMPDAPRERDIEF